MAKCPKCGADMVNDGDNLKCPDCNSTQIKESANDSQAKNGDAQQSELDLLKARIAELKKKQEKVAKQSESSAKIKEKLAPVAVFFKKWGLKAVLPAALFLIAFITLLVCFCGLRGIYVNVDNPNEFYSFSPTSYEYHGTTLTGEEYVDEGTWKTGGGMLSLTYEDEMFGKITDSYSFSHTGYDTVYITDSLGAKKQFKRVSILAYSTPQNIKVAVSLNGGTGSGASENKLSIGSKIKEPSEPTREGFQFMGWYTTADGWKTEGASQFNFNSRIWEDTTVYANWKDLITEYKLTGDMLPEEGVTFLEGDDLTQIYQSAGGVNEKIGNGSAVLEFKDKNGKIVSGAAPRSNVTVTLKEIVIGNNVSSIPGNAFNRCTSLSKVTIPDSVTSIGDRAFYYCNSLTSVTIGDGVTSIGDYAFYNCTSLKSVNIPYSVMNIGNKAFYNSKNTTTIYIGLPSTPSGWNSSWYGSGIKIVYDKTVTSSSNSNFNYYVLNDGIYITKYIGSETVVEIPGYIDGKKVVGLGSIFKSNTTVSSVTISDGIKAIPYRMFYGCTSLTSVTIPDSVTSIGDWAFRNCTSLTSVTIPNSVTSIGSYAFYNCTGLTEINWNAVSVKDFTESSKVFYNAGKEENGITVTFGDNVQKIPAYAFYVDSSSYYPNIKRVIIGNSVTSIGVYAFDGCTVEINWGNNPTIETISSYAFSGYKGTSITIPNSVTSIGDYAFHNCRSLTSVTIPDSVTSIGGYAFDGCTVEINWGNNPTIDTIDSYAFSGYKGTSITIPDTVTSIGDNAFNGCTSLTSVTIGDSVTSIGYSAFYDCDSLQRMTLPFVENPLGFLFGASNYFYQNSYIPHSLYIVEITGGNICDHAFLGCTSLTSVTIGDSVTSIGDGAFYNCTSLTSVTIPDSVTSIGSSAFNGCDSLTSVTIPDSVTSIGDYAFAYCSSLTIYCEAASQPSGWSNNWNYSGCPVVWDANNSDVADDGYIYYIDENGLRYALKDTTATVVIQPKNLSGNIEIPASVSYKDNVYSVTSIGNSAFYECTSLTSVTIPDGVKSIGEGAFSGCTSLTSVTIPDSVTSIGEKAFRGCESLETITVDSGNSVYHSAGNCLIETATKTLIAGCKNSVIPDDGSVTSIGDYAFYDCDTLTSVTIPDSVASIGDSAFSGCDSLTSVTIPDSVTSIGDWAFYECTSLTSVTIPDSVTSIGDYAFRNCSSLTSVTFEGTMAQWWAISKGNLWNHDTPFTKVVCSDGTVRGY